MTLGMRRSSAFGIPCIPSAKIGEEIRGALCRAKHEVFKLAGPTTKRFPLHSLRRDLAHAMCLDVVFSPRMVLCEPKESKRYPNSKLPKRKFWRETPVWLTAPDGAFRKANRFSSLLHLLVTRGFMKAKKVVPLLVRLSIYMWTISLADFYGICRKLTSIILDKKGFVPEPTLRFGALSVNPVLCTEKFLKPSRRKAAKRTYGVSRLPKTLGVAVTLRNEFDSSSSKRQRGLLPTG